MSNIFSLAMLSHPVAYEWLLKREEPTISSAFLSSSMVLRHRMVIDSELKTVEQLFVCVGVVNHMLIGYSFSNYHLVLSSLWIPTCRARCRRFAYDLVRNEFLELHWFPENQTVLASWFQFTCSQFRIRYLVLYEAPPPGKLPCNLVRSLEVVAERLPSSQCLNDEQARQLVEDGLQSSWFDVEQNWSIFPPNSLESQRHLGVFYGTARQTEYDRQSGLTRDYFRTFRQCIHVMKPKQRPQSTEKQPQETLKTVEIPVFQVADGAWVVEEFLLLEKYYLHGNKGNRHGDETSPVERRRRRRLILNKRKRKGELLWDAFQVAQALGDSLKRRLWKRNNTNHKKIFNRENKNWKNLLVQLCPEGVCFSYISSSYDSFE
ncbi:hypothetical protein GpartN1_g6269.t1 [Galdieria partita]|uniref:Uncharacterized protein n=1 Tax=Galdieria partita TaxID=83374 RepID=A0A9C7Q0Z5_9RHOD|nr:hypothetical protein GpartN1_g6269.t1 [Galdieria partita]